MSLFRSTLEFKDETIHQFISVRVSDRKPRVYPWMNELIAYDE